MQNFYKKKNEVTPLPIPAESADDLQNENDSDDEEYIQSEKVEEIIESETVEEIIESELRRKSLKVIQTMSRWMGTKHLQGLETMQKWNGVKNNGTSQMNQL